MSINKKEFGEYLQKAATGNNIAVTQDGEALVIREVVQAIVDRVNTESIIFNKAQKFMVENGRGNGVRVPYNISPLTNEATTGTRAYWVEEAAQSTASKMQLGQADLTFGKLVVRIPVTEELMADSALFSNYVIDQATAAIIRKIEREAIFGVGKSIKGIAGDGDGATLVTSTSADVTEAELKGFVDGLHPSAYKGAEWYVTAQQYSVITSIAYTAENSLAFEDGKYYLFGFPLNVIDHLTGTPYHVILGDFTAYGLGMRGPSIKESSDVRFDFGETEVRVCVRIAGQPLVARQTLDDSVLYGWFIVPEGGEALASSSSSSEEYSSSSSSTSLSSDSSESVGNVSSSSSSSSGV